MYEGWSWFWCINVLNAYLFDTVKFLFFIFFLVSHPSLCFHSDLKVGVKERQLFCPQRESGESVPFLLNVEP